MIKTDDDEDDDDFVAVQQNNLVICQICVCDNSEPSFYCVASPTFYCGIFLTAAFQRKAPLIFLSFSHADSLSLCLFAVLSPLPPLPPLTGESLMETPAI